MIIKLLFGAALLASQLAYAPGKKCGEHQYSLTLNGPKGHNKEVCVPLHQTRDCICRTNLNGLLTHYQCLERTVCNKYSSQLQMLKLNSTCESDLQCNSLNCSQKTC